MGNSGNQEFLPLLENLTRDEDPSIAEHARWSADKLRSGNRELRTDSQPG
jgi:hypothetical protein